MSSSPRSIQATFRPRPLLSFAHSWACARAFIFLRLSWNAIANQCIGIESPTRCPPPSIHALWNVLSIAAEMTLDDGLCEVRWIKFRSAALHGSGLELGHVLLKQTVLTGKLSHLLVSFAIVTARSRVVRCRWNSSLCCRPAKLQSLACASKSSAYSPSRRNGVTQAWPTESASPLFLVGRSRGKVRRGVRWLWW